MDYRHAAIRIALWALGGVTLVWIFYDIVKHGVPGFPRNRPRPFTFLYFAIFAALATAALWAIW
jgi:hypothetical protein